MMLCCLKILCKKSLLRLPSTLFINPICLVYTKGVRNIEVSSYADIMVGNLFRWSVFQNLEALFPIIVM